MKKRKLALIIMRTMLRLIMMSIIVTIILLLHDTINLNPKPQ